MLTFKEYQKKSFTTAVYPHKGKGDHYAIAYTALGLGGEVGEMQEKIRDFQLGSESVGAEKNREEFVKELGDIFWYFAGLSTELGIDIDDIIPSDWETWEALPHVILGLGGSAGRVQERIKKVLRDSGGVVTPEKKQQIQEDLREVARFLIALCRELGIEVELVLEGNIAKLFSRKDRGVLQGDGDNR
jgi:NTP pyrophosphatase (non-canonical NTP hydrolase)